MNREDEVWSVALFSSRESPALLLRSLQAVLDAKRPGGVSLIIDILVNGNPLLVSDFSQQVSALPVSEGEKTTVRVWEIAQPDKAYAWNRFIGELWPGQAAVTFFIDGYVSVDSSSLLNLAQALSTSAHAYATTSVPRMGPSSRRLAAELARDGGLNGNLFALSRGCIGRIRDAGFRMPLGIYRNDATLGAVLCFDFDPSRSAWDRNRILVVKEAGYWYPSPRLRPSSLAAYLKRRLRQAQGTLENLAVRRHFSQMKRLPGTMARTAHQLVTNWCEDHPKKAAEVFRRSPLAYIAYRRLVRAGPPNWENSDPRLVMLIGASRERT